MIVNYQKTINSMESASLIKTKRILSIMHVLAWVVFIGLMVQSGAILFGYVYSLVTPEAAGKLYTGLNLLELRQSNLVHYTIAMFFLALTPGLKAYIAFAVTRTLSNVNLQNPFTMATVQKLESISYDLVVIWGVRIVQHVHSEVWIKEDIHTTGYSGETLFIAGLVFVISQVFKRGVELQSESDLTV